MTEPDALTEIHDALTELDAKLADLGVKVDALSSSTANTAEARGLEALLAGLSDDARSTVQNLLTKLVDHARGVAADVVGEVETLVGRLFPEHDVTVAPKD